MMWYKAIFITDKGVQVKEMSAENETQVKERIKEVYGEKAYKTVDVIPLVKLY